MAAEPFALSVGALADGLKIAAPTSTAVYYKIIFPTTIYSNSPVSISINSSCMESGSSLSLSGTCDVDGANAVTFAYDTTSARIVAWSVE